MGLQDVIGEVESSGRRRAQELLDAAKAESDSIVAAAREKADAYKAQRLQEAERDVEQLHAQMISSAEFEARKRVLGAEAELRAAFQKALLDGFAALPAKTRQAHVKKLLAQAKDVVPDGKVWGAEKDKKALQSQKTFEFAGTTDIAGGIQVESKDGSIRVDLSYETLLQDQWRDVLRAEAALFA